MTQTLHDFSTTTLGGKPHDLKQYAGKVVLIVNTASKCGLTPQFEELQNLYDKFKDQGFVILGFPCNQFASQDPGSTEEIAEFCQLNYGVTFPMMTKVDVNGDNADPIWVWLKSQKGGLLTDAIKWNFAKFLVGKDGNVIKRYAPQTTPSKLEVDIVNALAA